MHPIDLEQFRARRGVEPQPAKRQRPPRHRSGEWFLKGPIPGAWLTRAAVLSYRALRVGLAIWYLVGLKKCRAVKPTWETWKRFGLSRDAARHGLAALEGAGLVSVDRHRGRCPVVTIQDVEALE